MARRRYGRGNGGVLGGRWQDFHTAWSNERHDISELLESGELSLQGEGLGGFEIVKG